MPGWRPLAAVVVAFGLVLGSCGGGGSNPPAGQSTAPRPDPAADKARAERINLTLADLGAGWTVDTTGASSSDEAFDRAFDQALAAKGIVASEARTADAEADFARGEDTAVSSTVSVYEEEGLARRDFSLAASHDFVASLSTSFDSGLKEELAKDPELQGVTLTPLRLVKVPFPALGQEAFAAKGQTTARGPGGRVSVHVHLVFIRQDRAFAGLIATALPEGVPGWPAPVAGHQDGPAHGSLTRPHDFARIRA